MDETVCTVMGSRNGVGVELRVWFCFEIWITGSRASGVAPRCVREIEGVCESRGGDGHLWSGTRVGGMMTEVAWFVCIVRLLLRLHRL